MKEISDLTLFSLGALIVLIVLALPFASASIKPYLGFTALIVWLMFLGLSRLKIRAIKKGIREIDHRIAEIDHRIAEIDHRIAEVNAEMRGNQN